MSLDQRETQREHSPEVYTFDSEKSLICLVYDVAVALTLNMPEAFIETCVI